MSKYFITWDAGYGKVREVVDFSSKENANRYASERGIPSSDYSAVEFDPNNEDHVEYDN